jgi:hypothetical protein
LRLFRYSVLYTNNLEIWFLSRLKASRFNDKKCPYIIILGHFLSLNIETLNQLKNQISRLFVYITYSSLCVSLSPHLCANTLPHPPAPLPRFLFWGCYYPTLKCGAKFRHRYRDWELYGGFYFYDIAPSLWYSELLRNMPQCHIMLLNIYCFHFNVIVFSKQKAVGLNYANRGIITNKNRFA